MELRHIEGGYRVSRCGSIISKRFNRPLKPSVSSSGYFSVSISIEGDVTTHLVHRLVAEPWVPNPMNLPQINHIDGDKLNNHIDNLEWCTGPYNMQEAIRLGLRKDKGVDNSNCKTDEDTVHKICNLLQDGLMTAKIRDMGFNCRLVEHIKYKDNWTHISKHYNF